MLSNDLIPCNAWKSYLNQDSPSQIFFGSIIAIIPQKKVEKTINCFFNFILFPQVMSTKIDSKHGMIFGSEFVNFKRVNE